MASFFLLAGVTRGPFLIPGGNTPASAGLLFAYVANSSTKTTLYKNNAGSASYTNPIVLDSGGNIPNNGLLWVATGVTVDVVLAPSNDTDPPSSPLATWEDCYGENDLSSVVSEWFSGPTPTFITATSFTLVGDQTGTFKKGRRVKTTNTAGTVYSTITASTFGALTTVSVANDSGILDSGLSAISYSLIDPEFPSIRDYYVQKKATAVASAGNGTTDIWGLNGDFAHITGTNAIRHFSSSAFAGVERSIVFDGELTLFSSAVLTIVGQGNVSTTAGDTATVRADTTSTAVVTQYMRASVQTINSYSLVRRKTADETVSSSAALQNDDHLTFPIAAGEEWIANFYLDIGQTLSATGVKLAITAPTGATLNAIVPIVLDSSVASVVNATVQRVTTSAQAVDFSPAICSSANNGFVHFSAWILNGGTASSVTLQFAQSSATTAALTFRKGSHMIAQRIA